jgi:pimeloyl-ACP methyl ester carboxylesterase
MTAHAQGPPAEAGRLIGSPRLIRTFSADDIRQWFKGEHIPRVIFAAKYSLKVYEILYYTKHADGRLVKASGLLYVPEDDPKSSPLLIYNHGSYACRDIYFNGKDEQVICMAFATDGYVVLCPDYIGMGEGEGNQMLLNASTEAGATVDMLLAIQSLLPTLPARLSKTLFLAGYSQGGHASMATYRLLQEKYKDRFPVTAASPMSGPYDVEGTVYNARLLPNENPVYLMLLLASYYESRDSMSQMGRALVHPYDSIIPPLMNGEWPEEVINSLLPDTCMKCVKPDLFKEFENVNSPLRQYLRANNVYDWRPESPTELCYCMHDEQVPYRNSLTAYNAMKKNGSTTVQTWLVGRKFRHINCASFAVVYTKMFFDGFLNGHPMSHGPLGKRALLNVGKLFVKP